MKLRTGMRDLRGPGAAQQRAERVDVDRLRQVIVEAGREGARLVLVAAVAGERGEPHGELAAGPSSVALGHDGPAMHPDQPLHDRETDAEAALRAVEGTLALREEVEDPRQEVRRQPHPVVAHAQYRLLALALE